MRGARGQPIRAEAKGHGSRLSKGQRNPDKTLIADPNKAINRQGQFRRSSGLDRQGAKETQARLATGKTAAYGVYNTKNAPKGFETKATTRSYALGETGTRGGPVTVTRAPSAIEPARSVGPRASAPTASSGTNPGATPTPPAAPLGAGLTGPKAFGF
jgi:hypothetical protein